MAPHKVEAMAQFPHLLRVKATGYVTMDELTSAIKGINTKEERMEDILAIVNKAFLRLATTPDDMQNKNLVRMTMSKPLCNDDHPWLKGGRAFTQEAEVFSGFKDRWPAQMSDKLIALVKAKWAKLANAHKRTILPVR